MGISPLEAVVDEADGDLKKEVLAEMTLNLVHREVIADKEINDLLSDCIGKAASVGHAFHRGGEELGALARGGIDADHQPPQRRLLVSQVSHVPCSSALAASLLPARRTRMLDRSLSFRLNNRGGNPRQTMSTHISPSLVA